VVIRHQPEIVNGRRPGKAGVVLLRGMSRVRSNT
jgi:hypothetical protein